MCFRLWTKFRRNYRYFYVLSDLYFTRTFLSWVVKMIEVNRSIDRRTAEDRAPKRKRNVFILRLTRRSEFLNEFSGQIKSFTSNQEPEPGRLYSEFDETLDYDTKSVFVVISERYTNPNRAAGF